MAATKFFLLFTLGFLSSAIAMKLIPFEEPAFVVIPVMSVADDLHFYEGATKVAIDSPKMKELLDVAGRKFAKIYQPESASRHQPLDARQKTVRGELVDSLKFVIYRLTCRPYVDLNGWDQCNYEVAGERATCVIEASATASWQMTREFDLSCKLIEENLRL